MKKGEETSNGYDYVNAVIASYVDDFVRRTWIFDAEDGRRLSFSFDSSHPRWEKIHAEMGQVKPNWFAPKELLGQGVKLCLLAGTDIVRFINRAPKAKVEVKVEAKPVPPVATVAVPSNEVAILRDVVAQLVRTIEAERAERKGTEKHEQKEETKPRRPNASAKKLAAIEKMLRREKYNHYHIARTLDVSRDTVYRVAKRLKEQAAAGTASKELRCSKQ
jgi:hypothetical protein